MHGPEHHAMVGSALLTAFKNAGGDVDLEDYAHVYGSSGGIVRRLFLKSGCCQKAQNGSGIPCTKALKYFSVGI